MSVFREKLRPAKHYALRWFLRLRVWLLVSYIAAFGVFELRRYYRLTEFTELPGHVQQSLVDSWDEFWGRNYLDSKPAELKAQADSGNAFAQYVYGRRHTVRVPIDYQIKVDAEIAERYMSLAAQGGNMRASAVMALLLKRKGTPADLERARVYAADAAKHDDALGLRVLAEIELTEANALVSQKKKDLEESGYRHLQRAMNRGNLNAARKLADLLVEGRDGYVDAQGEEFLAQNFSLALQYYQRAALGRDYESCLKLAEAYEKGTIAVKDSKEAYAWYLVAAQLKSKAPPTSTSLATPPQIDPVAELAKLRPTLLVSDLIAGQNLARNLLRQIPSEYQATLNSVLESR